MTHYLPAAAIAFQQQRQTFCCSDCLPVPATTFLQQQLSVLHLRLPSRSSYYLLAPAASNSTTAATSPAPVITSPDEKTCTSNPLLHQRLDPTPVPVPGFYNFRLRFAIIKFPFETTTYFCHSCLVCCQSLIFQKFVGSIYLSSTQQTRGFTFNIQFDKISFFFFFKLTRIIFAQ